MAEVPVTHAVLFIAAVALSAVIGGVATDAVSDVARSIEGIGSDYASEVRRHLTIISDPGAPVYDAGNDTLTLLVKNTGGSRLPTERDSLLVLVDGRPASVSNVTVADGSFWLPGNVARITANATLDDGAHRAVVTVGENRDHFTFAVRSGERDGEVVFAGSVSGLARSGATVEQYAGAEPAVVGPAAADFDGDGSVAAPYVVNATLRIADGDGSPRTLDGNPADRTTRLAVGTWNGSRTAVFFVNETNGDVYRTRPGASATRVYRAQADAIAGIADFDGDPAEELVYLDDSANVEYVDPDGTHHATGTNVGSNVETVGTPVDFDGDGVARVPFVSGSNNVVLAGHDGSRTKLTAPSAAKTGVAVDDVNADGDPEIVYVGSSSNYLRFVTLSGTTGTVRDGDGDRVVVDPDAGAA